MPMNMSYCRHHNTLQALRECAEEMDRTAGLSAAEQKARDSLLLLCRQIASDYECEIDEIEAQRRREKAQRRAQPATSKK